MDERKFLERITINPQILSGQPVIRDRQVLVKQIVEMLTMGETFPTIMEKYPELKQEDIQACLVYARQLVQRERATRWQPRSLEDLQSALPGILEQVPYLKLLVLVGSRARGDYNEKSDWDFAFLCKELYQIEPMTNADIFAQSIQVGILPETIGLRLAEAAKFRNILAHLYDKIEPRQVVENINPVLQDYQIYINCINDYLESLENR